MLSLCRYLLPIGSLGVLAAAIFATPLTTERLKHSTTHRVEFNRDIRPILDKCSSCHGHDPKAVRAGLRLDVREVATKKLDDGKVAIVPGHPEQSELVRRIYSTDKFEMMPPPSSNRVLSDEEKATLKEWIKEGAEYKKHWAFVKPVRSPIPHVSNPSWPHNAIDYFVLAKLDENGLKPSGDADKRTLIRRVSLDLDGLPPTPAETDAFLRDKSPNAYEKVVDRLLASPRYGERMAMDWMDCGRYADSNGYQSDWERFQYRWRDWVIDAYNHNMPYDEFTIDQLAGDLLPHPTLDQIIATGFNRNHRINTEGGVIPEEWRIENVIDRVSTTSEVWLGLTAGCARCHDHKYDPISQKDFYSLCAYFNNVPETGSGEERPVNHPPLIKAPYPEQTTEMAKLQTRLAELDTQIKPRLAANETPAQSWTPTIHEPDSLKTGLEARFTLSDLTAQLPNDPTAHRANASTTERLNDLTTPQPKAEGKVTFDPGRATGAVAVGDGGYLDLGDAGDFEADKPFSYSAWIYRQSDSGSPFARMETKADYRGWDCFIEGGNPAIHIIHDWPDNALKVTSTQMLPKEQWAHLAVTYDGSAKPAGIHMYIDGKPVKFETKSDSLKGTIHTAVHLRVGRRTDSDIFTGKVDDLMLFNRVLSVDEVKQLADVDPAQPIARIPADKRTPEQRATLTAAWSMEHDPTFKTLETERRDTVKKRDDLDSQITTVMIMKEMPKPRPAFVLIRGQYDHPGDPVTMRTPVAFPPMPAGVPNNRLGLAKWIMDPSNPLTARVAVNRMWERLFGTGIVATSEDFGTRSEFPSHPELLDWLATEFVRLKWNQKAMWKELVMSRTYRQDSAVSASLEKLDPNNRLLARGPRFRLSAEVIRDQALMAAGLLRNEIGGPSVRPYQPKGVWDDISVYGNLHNYKHDPDPNLHRRSLYTIWKRTAPPPDMMLFDAPSRETCVVRRSRTDTPLQALALMNDETYFEAARGLAEEMVDAGPSANKRLDRGFELVLGRNPTPAEESILSKGIQWRESRLKKDPTRAKKLVTIGIFKPDPKVDNSVLAAYTMAASTILNLDETITKQ